ncbi:MAG TPA: tail fiber domain-containing protein [Chitinophagales bacterium]|nr:tail fiber domain-containing protein [Chitinophagales bacterium]HRH53641.1 tail fiber domain-containing protein [Chitinophagales bacterium]
MKQILLLLQVCVISLSVIAQTNTFPTIGNVGIGTTTPTQLFQVYGGIAQFGGTSDYTRFATDGDLTFIGNADYLVGADRFAFRYQGNPNFGLVFSASNSRYEFRDGTGVPVFWQGGNGNAYIKGFLAIGSTTTPSAALDITSTNAAAIKINPFNTGAGNTGNLRFQELTANGNNYVGFKSPDNIPNNKIWVLPNADGTNGQYLKTDGAGNLGWATDAGTTYFAGAGISFSGTTINNTAPDQIITLSGTGAASVAGTYPNFTINSVDNNTIYTAGSGIDVTGTVITNLSPDQTITLAGDGATTITGTYPDFTISSTDFNTTYTAGSGIDITDATITNTAPDVIITLTGTGATDITGTYPVYTITSTDENTTYSAGAGITIADTVIVNTGDLNPADDANIALSNLSSTAINQSLIPDGNNTRDLGNTAASWKNIYTDETIYFDDNKFISNIGGSVFTGVNAGNVNAGANNSGYGNHALNANTTGTQNVAVGENAMYSNTTGRANTAIGFYTMYLNTNGINNVAIGQSALYSNTTINYTVAIGDSALFNNGIGAGGILQGTGNTAVGSKALLSNDIGYYNTATGYQSLAANTQGYNNSAHGYKALNANNSGFNNTAQGTQALTANTTGFDNTAAGYQSMYNNLFGDYNSAFGQQSLYSNTDGNYNTAIGNNALYTNNTGNSNIAVGHQTMYFNTTGTQNTATGNSALRTNSTGTNNTAFGFQAMFDNTTGTHNTSIGNESLINNTTGNYNSATGNIALYSNSTGSYNTATGHSAGSVNDNSTFCTYLGYDADQPDGTDISNSTAVGSASRITASNQVRVGASTVTSIGGFVNWTNVSDGRFKKNVQENVPGLEFINALQPVTYTLDVNGINHFLKDESNSVNEKSKIIYSGFIAQDVAMVAKNIGYDFSGVDQPENENSLYGLRYAEFVVPLVKAVQELDAADQNNDSLIQTQQKQIVTLSQKITELEKLIAAQLTTNTDGIIRITLEETNSPALLGQNIPNPFENSTVIPFRIPKNCNDASIVIAETSTGRIVRAIPVTCNVTQLSIEAGLLSTGNYAYSLYVDGEVIGTRQMVVVE